jgi:hypothetical protein
MKVLLDKNNVVIAKSFEIKKVENGFFVPEEDVIYALEGLQIIETTLNPKIMQDKLVNGKILPNPDYKTPEEIAKLTKDFELKRLLEQKVITQEEYEKIIKLFIENRVSTLLVNINYEKPFIKNKSYAQRSYVYEETSSKIITFNEHVKFYPDAIGGLMFLVENYPDFICVAELGEDEEDSVEILGNRQDLLPSSFQESLEHD